MWDGRLLVSICSCVYLCVFVFLSSCADIGGRETLIPLTEFAVLGTFGFGFQGPDNLIAISNQL